MGRRTSGPDARSWHSEKPCDVSGCPLLEADRAPVESGPTSEVPHSGRLVFARIRSASVFTTLCGSRSAKATSGRGSAWRCCVRSRSSSGPPPSFAISHWRRSRPARPLPDIDIVATLEGQKMNARYELTHAFYSIGLAIARCIGWSHAGRSRRGTTVLGFRP